MTLPFRYSLFVVALLTAACSRPPKETADRARAAADQFEREMNAEGAGWKQKADADFRKRIADPGSITAEASDTLIADLESLDPQTRARAVDAAVNPQISVHLALRSADSPVP